MVQDFATGEPLPDVVATIAKPAGSSFSATSSASGELRLRLAEVEGVVIRLEHAGYAPQFVALHDVPETGVLQAAWPLNPVALEVEFDATVAQVLQVPDSPAQVALPANALVLANGQPFVGTAKGLVTPIDPSADVAAMPGGMLSLLESNATPEPIESFGAMDVRFQTLAGAKLQLAQGMSATVRIPVAARARAGAPATSPLYYYDEQIGYWIQDGCATLQGVDDALYYEGQVSHFTPWNADRLLATVLYSSCVVDAQGNPVRDALVQATGVDYLAASSAWTDADGNFSLPVRIGSSFNVSATYPVRSRVRSETSGVDNTLNESCLVASEGEVRVTLSWGTEPLDLDLHMFAEGAHVSYSSTETTIGSATVWLDTDDTSSYGPEVISATYLPAGSYRFVVHHFSGASTITESPARLHVQARNLDRVFVPTENVDTNGPLDAWVAVDLVVDALGQVTIREQDDFASLSSVDYLCPDFTGTEPLCADFVCAGGGSIPRVGYCNGVVDCADASDEINDDCSLPMYECGDGQTIPGYARCDGTVDCENGSDEVECGGEGGESYICLDGGQAPLSYYCDGVPDCEDSSDENTPDCPTSVFFCTDGDYIGGEYRCDGSVECADGSDEQDCLLP